MVNKKNKIIIYELNEVPRKLYDFYIKQFPNSTFSYFNKNGLVFNTFTKDNGELHPWSTWPTVHRGVYNFQHNIRFINQDLTIAKQFKPVWEILSKNGVDTGVFGSLQSYPPIENNFIKFYLPDTFAPDDKANLESLSLFQSFNLSMANENKAKSRKIKKSQFKLFIKLMKEGVISMNTFSYIFKHLVKEKVNSKYKSRRSLIQNIIGFELFFKTLQRHKPSFCTYFTNHVAGMMHRYWRDLFPNEFNLDNKQIDYFHSKSILKAMHIADKDLQKLLKFSKSNGYDLWVISSMGQESIDRGEYIPELYLKDFQTFLSKLNLNSNNYELLPAMQPDYCISCSSMEDLNALRKILDYLRDSNGKRIINERYPPQGNRLNIILENSPSVVIDNKLKILEAEYSLGDFGFEIITRDIGTGYHIPEGIMLSIGANNSRLEKYNGEIIETASICPTILDLFEIEIKDYMTSPL